MREKRHDGQSYTGRYLHQSKTEGDLKEYKVTCRHTTPEVVDMYMIDKAVGVEVAFGANHVTYLREPIPIEEGIVSPDMPRPVQSEPWRYELLTVATIENTTNGESLDLIKMLPDEWRVFVDYSPEAFICAHMLQKSILMLPNFDYSSMILDLAHEVGHAVDSTKRPELFIYPQDPYEAETLILNIKKERTADAFAVHTMKKFMSPGAHGLFDPELFSSYNEACRQDQINDRLHKIQSRALSKSVAAAAMHRPTFG